MTLKAKDIAEMLGISAATISMVLNNKPGISDVRRAQVIEKINELGCGDMIKKKSLTGRNLGFVVYKRHGRMIGESPFYSLFLDGINDSVLKHGYNLMYIQVDKSSTDDPIQRIKSNNCDGLIILATEMLEDDLELFKNLKIPFIILDNYFVSEYVDSVTINNEQGTYIAVKHLRDMGHTKIGYLQSKVFINSFGNRIKGFFKALKKFNLEKVPDFIFPVGYSEEEAYIDMKKYLQEKKTMPTALMADNDILAFGAMRALKEYGYKIPEDISIVGFDDRPICLLTDPKLSTVNVPKNTFGILAVDLLVDHLKHPQKEPLRIEIQTHIIKRDSVKKIN